MPYLTKTKHSGEKKDYGLFTPTENLMTGCQCNVICLEMGLAEMHEAQVGTTKALSGESADIRCPPYTL